MASRRANPPANGAKNTSRPRTVSTTAATRPKSMFSLPSTARSSTDDFKPTTDTIQTNTVPNFASSTPLPSRANGLPGLGAESNIQVVVRCRGRSSREIAESSPCVVQIDGTMASEVVIQTSAPKTVLGVTTPADTRTYPFDRVFGFAADQAMIYKEVVEPMLSEVLMGYNCTLFAYGQTGTGKTYTMQGDLTPSISGGPSAGAGMIPRVLSNLFAHLEANVPDYSVKVTFVELYNEELRDLLAPSLSAPAGSEQPMSKGGSVSGHNNGSGDSQGPKIFEDARGGVFIQGLEECFVRNAQEAIARLRKGSERRQIAATKFNDHSSRSHSVFTVTVCTKTKDSSGVAGEDYIRVGKLNLVDLAGSENIGRSGAENQRAREAGNINMSLLALGRVINALVAKHSHIPYRESKLTRLLQDSLGGKTKTCIIATISPTQSNLEETFSTLDYALRAKSIRNKPEVNQRMTRNSLLKEYISLIETLKSDLLAAREKNGIYMSKESWDSMASEQAALQQAYTDRKQQCDTLEAQIRIIQDELTESLGMLMKRDSELSKTKAALQSTSDTLATTTQTLEVTQKVHQEEVILREAHQLTEDRLDVVAQGLKEVAATSIGDVGSLFKKLERKEQVRESNAASVKEWGAALESNAAGLNASLKEFVAEHTRVSDLMRAEAKHFKEMEVQSLNGLEIKVEESIEALSQSMRSLKTNEQESSAATDQVQQLIQTHSDSMKHSFESWASGMQKHYTTLCTNLLSATTKSCQLAEESMRTSKEAYDTLIKDTISHLNRERELVGEAQGLVKDAVSAEIQRLHEQNALLKKMLASEEEKALTLQADLVSNMASLIQNFTTTRSEHLREAASNVQSAISQGAEEMESFGLRHGKAVTDVLGHGKRVISTVSERSKVGQEANNKALSAIKSVGGGVHSGLVEMQRGIGGEINGQLETFRKHKEGLDKGASAGFSRVGKAKRARTALTESLGSDLLEGYRTLQSGIATRSRNLNQSLGSVLEKESTLRETTQAHKSTSASQIHSLRKATRALMENATREDVPTGSTPRKRVWEYDDDWERTGTREAVLRDWAMRKQLDQQLKRDEEVRKRFSVSVSAAPVAHNIADDPSDPEEVDDAETGDTASAHEEPASEPAEELVEPAPAPAPTPVFSIVAPSKDSKLVPASTVRSSRQSKMLPPSRPPSKIGTASRTISGKGVPLTEKGNTASRNKRVK